MRSLSDFNNQVFTLINRVPRDTETSATGSYIKHVLKNCGKKSGIYDRASGTMAYSANSWTAYLYDWKAYKPANWLDGGYYQMSAEEKANYFTVAVGDLLIFADIQDEKPATLNEFNAIKERYKDIGGIISSFEVYIQYKPNGEPWNTNHIEAVKG